MRLVGVLLGMLVLAGGCGYSVGGGTLVVPEGARTVSI